MILLSLELHRFRNYQKVSIEFDKKRNILSGKNAQGKTNILEAIYLLCISRSFRTKYEKETIKFEEDSCSIQGEFKLDNGLDRTVIFHYSREAGKQLSINRKRITKLSEYIGQFPIVLSSPEEYNLTSGPPAERRRFIDILLSQVSVKYLHHMQDYYQIVKQRNSILNERKYDYHQKNTLLGPWNESFIEKGSWIIWERMKFLDRLNLLVKDIYTNLTNSNEQVNLSYATNFNVVDLETLKKSYQNKLESLCKAEVEQGNTLIGPHRDDFIFLINDKELRKYGSRGQHKTVLIALMIAEYKLIKEKVMETPILLIDDLFSEIDHSREMKILSYLNELGQHLITSTFEFSEIKSDVHAKFFQIKNGQIEAIG